MRLSRSILAVAAVVCAGLTAIGTASPAVAAGVQFGGPIVVPNIPVPGAAGSPTGAASGGFTIPSYSLNWSGYAVQGGGQRFNYVSDTFTEPTVTCTGFGLSDSEWVGLDGLSDQTVEQDGTGAACAGPGYLTPYYRAWVEMYPQPSKSVFAVAPGDVISASVKYGAGTFTLTIADLTSGASYTETANCATCARSSAEWINERPAWCNSAQTKCALSALADFSQTTKGYAVAGTDTSSPKPIGGFSPNYNLTMVNPITGGGFESLDTVGPLLGSAGSAFTTTWNRTGTPYPITL